MPVLAPEPYIYPDNIIDFELEKTTDLIGDEEERWWALHLRPRSEKSLSRCLLRNHISFFLPLFERRRRIQRRQVCSYLPLFPGYLFLRGGDTARRIAIETNLVAGSLFVEDQKQFLKDISLILRLMRSGSALSPTERLQPGMPAEIISGPLAGIRGKIMRKTGTRTLKFVIEVEFLQRGTSVEVESSMVQPL
jgi:transcriptional antiterminator RfaH